MVDITIVFEEPAASIFYTEYVGSRFLQTLVNIYLTTKSHILEDSILYVIFAQYNVKVLHCCHVSLVFAKSVMLLYHTWGLGWTTLPSIELHFTFGNLNAVTFSFVCWSDNFITITSLSSAYTTCSWIYKCSTLLQHFDSHVIEMQVADDSSLL
jgi:hypothetical protein